MLSGIRFPPTSPWISRHWRLICGLNVFPLTAAFHNPVFYRPTCMLNNFGLEYDLPTIGAWLARDPSLPWALFVSLCVYLTGLRIPLIQTLAAPVSLAFLPLTIWIWDIPFTGRIVCHSFHDSKLVIGGSPVHTRHLYELSLVLYVVLLAFLVWSSVRSGHRVTPEARAPFDSPVKSAND